MRDPTSSSSSIIQGWYNMPINSRDTKWASLTLPQGEGKKEDYIEEMKYNLREC
jgi:hypothetical protein